MSPEKCCCLFAAALLFVFLVLLLLFCSYKDNESTKDLVTVLFVVCRFFVLCCIFLYYLKFSLQILTNVIFYLIGKSPQVIPEYKIKKIKIKTKINRNNNGKNNYHINSRTYKKRTLTKVLNYPVDIN